MSEASGRNPTRELNGYKAKLEHFAVTRFCELHDAQPALVRPNDPPAPDFTIKIGDQEVLLELTQYRELGPHNDATERDQEFKAYFGKLWANDPSVNELLVSLSYRRNGEHFRIPSVRNNTHKADAVISEVKALGILYAPHERLKVVTIRVAPKAELAIRKRRTPGFLYVAEEDYPALADYLDEIDFWYTGATCGCPCTSVQTRLRAVDLKEIIRVVRQKHSKLPTYRSNAEDRSVWLLLYDEGLPPTGRLREREVLEVVQGVRGLLAEFGDQFDSIWWGHNLLAERTCDSSLHRVV